MDFKSDIDNNTNFKKLTDISGADPEIFSGVSCLGILFTISFTLLTKYVLNS